MRSIDEFYSFYSIYLVLKGRTLTATLIDDDILIQFCLSLFSFVGALQLLLLLLLFLFMSVSFYLYVDYVKVDGSYDDEECVCNDDDDDKVCAYIVLCLNNKKHKHTQPQYNVGKSTYKHSRRKKENHIGRQKKKKTKPQNKSNNEN